jgi:hypothetical protein
MSGGTTIGQGRCQGRTDGPTVRAIASRRCPRKLPRAFRIAAGTDAGTEGESMPRYLVERTFPDGLAIPLTDAGAATCLAVVGRNAEVGVTWVHSCVSEDRREAYCGYDGSDPEAVRRAADANGLPVDRITLVSVLDPYFYR